MGLLDQLVQQGLSVVVLFHGLTESIAVELAGTTHIESENHTLDSVKEFLFKEIDGKNTSFMQVVCHFLDLDDMSALQGVWRALLDFIMSCKCCSFLSRKGIDLT